MDPAEFASPENFPCLLWIVAVDEGATRTLVFGGEWDISNCEMRGTRSLWPSAVVQSVWCSI